ncbi:MAG: efflux RND transporter permease subunit [Alphaproteobacteria bacterium]
MNIAEYAIQNRLIMWLVVIISLIGGYYAYETLPRFEDPEFTIRTAQIYTSYPGATPEEVANEVSDAIETELQSMQEVDEIRSVSSYGFSLVEVDIKNAFSPNKDALGQVFNRLRSKVQDAEAALPTGAGKPVVNDEFGDVFGLYYVVTGNGYSLAELYEYVWDLRTELLAVDDVAKIRTFGDQTEAIYIEVARDRAAAFGVELENVFADLSGQNAVVSAGTAEVGNLRVVIHPTGELDSVKAIENVVVSGTDSSDIVYLRDVATVTRGYVEPARSLARYNGEPAIVFGISNVSGSNVAKMGEAIRVKLAEMEVNRPLGIEVHEFYHQGDAVNESVESFVVNVVAAVVIVLVTLLIFMGLRSALIIGGVLVITIAATLLTMYFVALPMHRISLGALIIALGMLVDNAIVVTDGILVGISKGERLIDSAKSIVGKTIWSLLGGTLVGIIAFAPIGFAPGNAGEYCNHLFWVILISLGYSWLFAITLVPMFASLIIKEQAVGGADDAPKENRAMALYKRFLGAALDYRYAVFAIAIGAFVAALWSFQFVKNSFFPTATTEQIAIDFFMPEGTDIQRTSDYMAEVEAKLAEYDGVETVHTVIGGGTLRYMLIYRIETPNSSYAQILLNVKDLDTVTRLMPVLQRDMDEGFPEAQARVSRFVLGPSQGPKIEANFLGPDPKVLRKLASEAKAIMAANPYTIGVKTDWRQQKPVFEPRYASERGNRVGVSREALAETLNATFSGRTVGTYREGDDLIPIIYRAPERERRDLDTGLSIQIPSSRTGQTVPLSETVEGARVVWRDSMVRREDRVWSLTVQADAANGLLPSQVLAQVQPAIEAIELPPGYRLRWDGEAGDSAEANGQLGGTIPLGFLAMVLVVVLLFNALRQPLSIWLMVPMVVVGVVIGLLSTGTPLEFMAILGVLSLAGLLIKNAIVLVDQMDLEIREGKPRFNAVIDSAASRVRPVMLGALTTVLGVIPLMSDVFFGSMAVVIVYGLTFATVLTLVLLPAVYAALFNIGRSEWSESAA